MATNKTTDTLAIAVSVTRTSCVNQIVAKVCRATDDGFRSVDPYRHIMATAYIGGSLSSADRPGGHPGPGILAGCCRSDCRRWSSLHSGCGRFRATIREVTRNILLL